MRVLALKNPHTLRKEIDISGRALTMSGLIPAHSKDSEFSSFYSKISQRGSKMKAVIACAHKFLRIIYKLLSTKQTYQKEKALGLRKQF